MKNISINTKNPVAQKLHQDIQESPEMDSLHQFILEKAKELNLNVSFSVKVDLTIEPNPTPAIPDLPPTNP